MKKIGILTMYYKNLNYGGMLQAYALTEIISKLGYNCEQICKKHITQKDKQSRNIKNFNSFAKYLLKSPQDIVKGFLNKCFQNKLNLRNLEFERFQTQIPHSKKVYDSTNIKEVLSDYDIFIAGSDQIWNMRWYNSEYFLDFVSDDKYKFSYAASMPNIKISDEQKNIVKEHLKSFNDISVREKETVDFLENLTGKSVEWVLDPTLLLDADDWDKISCEKIVDEQYIFCYFIGEKQPFVKEIKKFAKETNLKIVTIPHMGGVCKTDLFFGDIKIYGVSPEKFVSLIKYADYVITDSFHAAVFSNIYKTKYYVFDRAGAGAMSSRIINLLSLTEGEERFCYGEKIDVNYMLSIKDKAVCNMPERLNEMKQKSMEFLKRNLCN